jgi:hypothetical protein
LVFARLGNSVFAGCARAKDFEDNDRIVNGLGRVSHGRANYKTVRIPNFAIDLDFEVASVESARLSCAIDCLALARDCVEWRHDRPFLRPCDRLGATVEALLGFPVQEFSQRHWFA